MLRAIPAAAVLLLCGVTGFGDEKIDFNRDVRPLISSNCIACHGPDAEEREAGLRLDTQEGSRENHDGVFAIVPGKPMDSEAFLRIITDDEDERMPPEGKGRKFTKEEADVIRKWIEQGAEYDVHWAYQAPKAHKAPAVTAANFPVRNPIDAFVLEKQKESGLKPSAEADRLTLARRVAIDLTGLPPTPAEADAFVADKRPDAYERFVDAQLAKPAYGERWARMWLDLARYADSAGYADDPGRTIWGYRDWVIRAFNANQPFNEFTIDQIAGDLRDKPTNEQLIATAFHRNTLTNNEGGTNNEEFRNVAVIDRVNTTMEVWMGTTMACAQCHTHKYDPITHHEYFQFFDFFNQSEDADRRNEAPLTEVWTEDQKAKKAEWLARIEALKKELQTDTPALAAHRKAWLERMQQVPNWRAPQFVSAAGADLKHDAATNRISLAGKPSNEATYKLKFNTQAGSMSGMKLSIPAEQKTNVVLSKVTATWTPKDKAGIEGRFVRIELPGNGKMIHLAEVQVFSGGENLSLKGKAKQSSTAYNAAAERAIDGKTDGNFDKGSVTHTATEKNPWFEVDLQRVAGIDRIAIWNRSGNNLEDRLAGYRVKILDAKRKVVWEKAPKGVPKPKVELTASGARALNFTTAVADFTQQRFNASDVLNAKIDKNKGWAIGGATGKAHELTLFLDKPIKLGAGTLKVELAHKSKHKALLLTHFDLTLTDSANAGDWARLPANLRKALASGKPSAKDQDQLAKLHRDFAPQLAPQRKEIAKLENSVTNARPMTTVPIMKDFPKDKYRKSHIHLRGNYKSLGDETKMGTPAVFHPLRKDLPRNRLALAHWLVDKNNPLTARVTVNRFWDQIFGIGIVSTNEEFGAQGELPSHPEMLDWLAVDFQKDWDVKRLLKQLVMTSAYRQQSATTAEAIEVDPENRLLARGPRFRISAEMVRDQALFAGGLLSAKMHGPPVKPPQPNLGLKAAFGSQTDWKTSAGEDKFRRGLYTTWRRSSPYPSMAAFDAPNREVCTSRRGRTNTPLQALVTLNDPVYVEAAQSLARRMAAVDGSPEEKLALGFRRVLIRSPKPAEEKELLALFDGAKSDYAGQPERAKTMAENPIGPLPAKANPAAYAAWTVVANVLLNLDETFLKR